MAAIKIGSRVKLGVDRSETLRKGAKGTVIRPKLTHTRHMVRFDTGHDGKPLTPRQDKQVFEKWITLA